MNHILLLFLGFTFLVACKNDNNRQPSNGEASVMLNQELWESDVYITNRDSSAGWDVITLLEYWPDGATKAELSFPLELDLLYSSSTHPLSSNIISYPVVELDSIILSFGYRFPEGDAVAAVYRVSRPSDLSNEISFELDADDPKLIIAKWSAELYLNESWRASAESEGHPDTIRMENGVAKFRLP